MILEPLDPPRRSGALPIGKAVALCAVFYTACVSLATWPRILWFRSALPSLDDPLQHLWIMRWFKTCLWEGQSPVLCPELHVPTGAPLGCFSPLHLQSLLYILLSSAIPNDVLCYNLIWLSGLVGTGLGTFVLIRHILRDAWCAGFGGMLAMLSGPMLLHAQAHLELICLGGFPLFLWSWIRFVDRPNWKRWATAVGLYLLLAVSAAYFAIFVTFPSVLYVAWRLPGRRDALPWLRARVCWLLAFAALVVPCLLGVFGNQLWAQAHGYASPRRLAEFRGFGAPLWSYALPSRLHRLSRLLPSPPYLAFEAGGRFGECCSYLGVVSLALLAYAAAGRVRFPRASYWWAALALLVVLSGGASWTLGGYHVPLPGLWLKKFVFAFRMIRVPARFNLFVGVVVAVVASGGLRHLLARLPHRGVRTVVFVGITGAALADLALVPDGTAVIPAMPGCYAFMRRTAPDAAFLEFPHHGSEGSHLNAVCGYWQSLHRGRTSAGYCGQGNAIHDNAVSWNSPFGIRRLAPPDHPTPADRVKIDVLGDFGILELAWLFLTVHDFRFAVLHQWAGSAPESTGRLGPLRAVLERARVYEDAGTVVYDRDRLAPPARPVALTTRGWRPAWHGKLVRLTAQQARLAVYTPDSALNLRVKLDAASFQQARNVRLLASGQELARWLIRPGPFRTFVSPTFRLPRGVHELVLASEGEDRPRSWFDADLAGDLTPYSLKVARVRLEDASTPARPEPDRP